MPDCTLKTKPENALPTGRWPPEASSLASAAGAKSTRVSRMCCTPKLSTAAAKSTGVVSLARNRASSWS